MIDHHKRTSDIDPHGSSVAELVEGIRSWVEPVANDLARLRDEDLRDRYARRYGSGGPTIYFYELARLVRTQASDFAPLGLDPYLDENADLRAKETNRKLQDIIQELTGFVFERLKQEYGSKETEYWAKGVSNAQARKRARDKQEEAGMEFPPEVYLDVMDLKNIVEHRQNWHLFESQLDIVLPGQTRKGKNTAWIARINELRRVFAHPYMRKYKDEDMDLVDQLYEEFKRKTHQRDAA